MPICKKCNQNFPSSMKINDKLHNLSKRSYCLNCSPFKQKNRRTLCNYNDIKKTKKCSICKQWLTYNMFYMKTNGNLFPYCIQCEKLRKKNKQREFKQQCVDYKGGKCQYCGYNKCLSALDFHHIDFKQKDFGISTNKRTLNDKVKDELDKCVLLCANCHRELHDNE